MKIISMDLIFMLLVFSMAIACTVREVQLLYIIYPAFNRGSFASAAAFGYLSTIIYIILIVNLLLNYFYLKRLVSGQDTHYQPSYSARASHPRGPVPDLEIHNQDIVIERNREEI
jgi:hypothetical protein